ncbi:hypothetical protein BLA29_007953 [Euroglyphus maynei]|uniref:Uncharacterized protein n=1 Tax=Euroglyphus maynei TaxID=6958 RepID=A0A1Y3BQ41_EURMA|nr:hypothetical protein BLA29_007953 [Euroglyphus maynei]
MTVTIEMAKYYGNEQRRQNDNAMNSKNGANINNVDKINIYMMNNNNILIEKIDDNNRFIDHQTMIVVAGQMLFRCCHHHHHTRNLNDYDEDNDCNINGGSTKLMKELSTIIPLLNHNNGDDHLEPFGTYPYWFRLLLHSFHYFSGMPGMEKMNTFLISSTKIMFPSASLQQQPLLLLLLPKH